MSPYRGPLRTLVAAAATLIILFGLFGCGSDDPSVPEVGVGTIEIKMPVSTDGATWHLYGPGNVFYHGDADIVMEEMPAGQYTIIWTAVKNWTGPMPYATTLKGDATLTLNGEYQDKDPGSNFVLIENADFIQGSDDGSRAYWEYRDTTITRIVIDPIPIPPDTSYVDIDTTVIDTLYYPAELGRDADEDRRRVQISYAHYIGKTEITNQEYVELGNWALSMDYATATDSSLVDAMGSTEELINFNFANTPIDIQDGMLRLKNSADANHPLIEVTWYGAAAYCDWLSINEGLEPAYDHFDWTLQNGNYRLPMEAEWENACRAGTTTAFSSGDIINGDCTETSLDGTAWYCGNAGGSSQDVGTKAANPWGLFDLHGNVWEWCNDFYAEYEVPDLPTGENDEPLMFYTDDQLTPVINPVGPEAGENKVVRSGRWLLASSLCRSAGRMMGVPAFTGINIGFRVAYLDPITP